VPVLWGPGRKQCGCLARQRNNAKDNKASLDKLGSTQQQNRVVHLRRFSASCATAGWRMGAMTPAGCPCPGWRAAAAAPAPAAPASASGWESAHGTEEIGSVRCEVFEISMAQRALVSSCTGESRLTVAHVFSLLVSHFLDAIRAKLTQVLEASRRTSGSATMRFQNPKFKLTPWACRRGRPCRASAAQSPAGRAAAGWAPAAPAPSARTPSAAGAAAPRSPPSAAAPCLHDRV